MKLLKVFVVMAAIAIAQTTLKPTSYAEITGDAATHQLASTGTCRSVLLVAGASNSASVRIGDSTVGASKGIPMASGSGLSLPVMTLDSRQTTDQRYIELASWYYYAATGDKLNFICMK